MSTLKTIASLAAVFACFLIAGTIDMHVQCAEQFENRPLLARHCQQADLNPPQCACVYQSSQVIAGVAR